MLPVATQPASQIRWSAYQSVMQAASWSIYTNGYKIMGYGSISQSLSPRNIFPADKIEDKTKDGGYILFMKGTNKGNIEYGGINLHYNNCFKEYMQYGENILQVVSDGQRNSISDY